MSFSFSFCKILAFFCSVISYDFSMAKSWSKSSLSLRSLSLRSPSVRGEEGEEGERRVRVRGGREGDG